MALMEPSLKNIKIEAFITTIQNRTVKIYFLLFVSHNYDGFSHMLLYFL